MPHGHRTPAIENEFGETRIDNELPVQDVAVARAGSYSFDHSGVAQKPMRSDRSLLLVRASLMSGALLASSAVLAQGGAHVHGLVHLDVAIEARTLTVALEAPLDSLLGFEHRPRTPAQRKAADDAMKRMNKGASLIRPAAAAQCALAKTTVESGALQAAAPSGAEEDEHADLDATFVFTCAQPDKLASIELRLFDAFQRIQRIKVQVAGPQGQSKHTLRRPHKLLELAR